MLLQEPMRCNSTYSINNVRTIIMGNMKQYNWIILVANSNKCLQGSLILQKELTLNSNAVPRFYILFLRNRFQISHYPPHQCFTQVILSPQYNDLDKNTKIRRYTTETGFTTELWKLVIDVKATSCLAGTHSTQTQLVVVYTDVATALFGTK